MSVSSVFYEAIFSSLSTPDMLICSSVKSGNKFVFSLFNSEMQFVYLWLCLSTYPTIHLGTTYPKKLNICWFKEAHFVSRFHLSNCVYLLSLFLGLSFCLSAACRSHFIQLLNIICVQGCVWVRPKLASSGELNWEQRESWKKFMMTSRIDVIKIFFFRTVYSIRGKFD